MSEPWPPWRPVRWSTSSSAWARAPGPPWPSACWRRWPPSTISASIPPHEARTHPARLRPGADPRRRRRLRAPGRLAPALDPEQCPGGGRFRLATPLLQLPRGQGLRRRRAGGGPRRLAGGASAGTGREPGDDDRGAPRAPAGGGGAGRAGGGDRRGRQRRGYRRPLAGDPRPVGTINTLILIDGHLTDGGLVNACLSASEAKVRALHSLGVLDPHSGTPASGTSTDCLAVAATQAGAVTPYAGSGTRLGRELGQAVYRATRASLLASREWRWRQEEAAHG